MSEQDQPAGRPDFIPPMHGTTPMYEVRQVEPRHLVSATDEERGNTVAIDVAQIESYDYTAQQGMLTINLRSGRQHVVQDVRARPLFDALNEALSPAIQPVVVPARKPVGRRQEPYGGLQFDESGNAIQPGVKPQNMPPIPGIPNSRPTPVAAGA